MTQQIAHHLLGASEAACALGLHPYKAPLTLWLEKTGQAPRFEGNDASEYGQAVEPIIREWFVRRYNAPVWVPPASLVSAEYPFLRGTPDGIVLRDADAKPDDPANWLVGFEAKNTGWRQTDRWGEPGTDAVPVEHLIQAQQNMLIAGLDLWHVAASIGGTAPVVYDILRDEELLEMIVDGGRRFMAHVADGTPPPVDGTEAWSAYVRQRYPWSREDFVKAGPAEEALAVEWKEAAAELDRLEQREAELKNLLAAAIGTASGMETAVGKITYRPRKGGPDYKAAFEGLARDAELSDQERAELLATHQRSGSRPLLRPRAWSKA